MAITINIPKEQLDRAIKTITIQQTSDSYLVELPILGIHKIENFELLVNFLWGFYEDSKK